MNVVCTMTEIYITMGDGRTYCLSRHEADMLMEMLRAAVVKFDRRRAEKEKEHGW